MYADGEGSPVSANGKTRELTSRMSRVYERLRAGTNQTLGFTEQKHPVYYP